VRRMRGWALLMEIAESGSFGAVGPDAGVVCE
jgi:hypothetical protein